MGTFVSVVDFIFLLLLFLYVSSVVWKGSGSVLLATAIAMAAAVFVVVSFTAASGLVKSTSFLTHAILLLAYVGLGGMMRATWIAKPAE